MLKEIDKLFDMNSIAFLYSERHLNLKMIILKSFSFHGVLTSRSNFTIVFLFNNLMFVKTENQILCH